MFSLVESYFCMDELQTCTAKYIIYNKNRTILFFKIQLTNVNKATNHIFTCKQVYGAINFQTKANTFFFKSTNKYDKMMCICSPSFQFFVGFILPKSLGFLGVIFCRSLFVLYLSIVLSVFRSITASDCTFAIF